MADRNVAFSKLEHSFIFESDYLRDLRSTVVEYVSSNGYSPVSCVSAGRPALSDAVVEKIFQPGNVFDYVRLILEFLALTSMID